ncbi:hypothetical protein [Prosthecobacter sp.]|uniref:helix-turn-helix transcriptional regulator n=1 Tax=Prosthecobacter sp. TaxID=1965333 RepID=UPI001D4B4DFD|nr:hypothetical protein [Prosthecobacter sp.]MCB1276447.1 hypothetical protein [Prosthecobacter sp.]
MNEERLINFKEVAQMLGEISIRSIRRVIAKGELPQPIRVLSVPTLPLSEVQAYIERKKNERGGNKQ